MTNSNDATVWDLPVRLFHWSIVVLLGIAWWSGEQHRLDVHRIAGYSILTLVLFRLSWGFLGSTPARFATFIARPGRVWGYIRNEFFDASRTAAPGHNPLGGWSVLALVGTMLLQTLLGLIAVDVDGIESGPFAHLVSFDAGRVAAEIHGWVFDGLLVLVALHIAAVGFYYLYKKQNLTAAMIRGRRSQPDIGPAFQFPSPLRALALFALSAAAVILLVQVFGR